MRLTKHSSMPQHAWARQMQHQLQPVQHTIIWNNLLIQLVIINSVALLNFCLKKFLHWSITRHAKLLKVNELWALNSVYRKHWHFSLLMIPPYIIKPKFYIARQRLVWLLCKSSRIDWLIGVCGYSAKTFRNYRKAAGKEVNKF